MINAVESSMGMHRIMCRITLDQGLFFFVQGAVRANPAVSVSMAVMDFCETYAVPADYAVMRTKYYRMLQEYRTDATNFKEQIAYAVSQ